MDVILSGSEGGTKDLQLDDGLDVVDGSYPPAWRAIPSTLVPVHASRKVPRRAGALLRMTSAIRVYITGKATNVIHPVCVDTLQFASPI